MGLYGNRLAPRLGSVVYVVVVAIVVVVLLDRLQGYAKLAERAAMETTLVNLQTALQVEFILASAHGDPAALARRWRGGNPIALVGAPPPNYLGERSRVDPSAVPGGSWLFDRDRGELVYVPRSDRFLSLPGSSARNRALRFALAVEGPPRSPGWSVRLAPVSAHVRRAK